jgi:hypothetical protein
MSKYAKKLGADASYKRPKKTFQEQLTADEISEMLQGYEKVDDISEVPLNTHLRYFTTQKDGTQVFRTGGFLKNKQKADTFVILTNGKNDWSVQTKGAVFFRKLSGKDQLDAIHELYKKKLAEKDKIIAKLKLYIKEKVGEIDVNSDTPVRKSIVKKVSKPLIKKSSKSTTKKSSKSSKSKTKKSSTKKPKKKSTSGSKTAKKKK